MLGKPHETSFPQELYTVKDRFGLNSQQEGLNPTSGRLPSVLSPTRSAGPATATHRNRNLSF